MILRLSDIQGSVSAVMRIVDDVVSKLSLNLV